MEFLSLLLFWLSGSAFGTAVMVYKIGQTTKDTFPDYAEEGRKIAGHGLILTMLLLGLATFIRHIA